MPQYLGDTLVVTKDELVPSFWSCYNSLSRRLRSDRRKGYGIERAQKGGGLDNVLLIKFDTLPKRIKESILAKDKKNQE